MRSRLTNTPPGGTVFFLAKGNYRVSRTLNLTGVHAWRGVLVLAAASYTEVAAAVYAAGVAAPWAAGGATAATMAAAVLLLRGGRIRSRL